MSPHNTFRPLHGIYIPNEGTLDSNAHIQALKTILSKKKNVELRNDTVVKIDVKSHKVSGIELASGAVLHPGQVVLANGTKAQELIDPIKELASKMPRLLYGVGYSATLSQQADNPVQQVIRTPNRAGACGLHVLPRGGKLYVGATNMVYNAPEVKLRAGLSMFLLECAITQINGSLYGSHIEDWIMGYRPATLDTFPLIGKTSIEGLWILSGTYRDGFHQSPLLATHMAHLLLGKQGLFDQHLFAPERKLISTMTKEEAIAEFVEHFVACMAEHGENTPVFMRSKSFKEILEIQFFENLYNQLGTNVGFAPDILFMFALDENSKELISSFKKYFL
jgi:glycine/D-amino acid oxidase-like deaminating enzyme